MMYAIYAPTDQTICYLNQHGEWTTSPREALLYSFKEDAESDAKSLSHSNFPHSQQFLEKAHGKGVFWCEVEEIEDEAEFKSRPSTW